MHRQFAALFVTAAMLAAPAALALPTYYIDGGVNCGGPNSTFVLIGATPQVEGARNHCGYANASSSEFGLGVVATTDVIGASTAAAWMKTPFSIVSQSGIAELITVSINLAFDVQFGKGLPGSNLVSYRTANFGASVVGQTSFAYSEMYMQEASDVYVDRHYINGALRSEGPLFCFTACVIETPGFQIWTDTPYDLRMDLFVSAFSALGNHTTEVDAYNTFYFPSDRGVFNGLRTGDIVDIPALSIVNNRVPAGDDGGSNGVPEPGTLALLGIGLIGLIGARRRRAKP